MRPPETIGKTPAAEIDEFHETVLLREYSATESLQVHSNNFLPLADLQSFTRSCCSCCVEVARAAKIYSKSLTTIERCEKSCQLCIWYWACWWLGLLWAELSAGTPMTNVNFCWYKQDLHFEDHWIRDLKLHQYEEVWCGSFCLGH